MKFKPQTETEIAASRAERQKLLDPSSAYDFEVYTATEGKSKSSGNDMFTLTLNIDSEHGKRQIRDYLTSTQEDKLFEFCRSVGMTSKYSSGNLTAQDLLGAEGKCRVAIEKGTASPDGGNYPDKNKIVRYLAPVSAANGSPTPAWDKAEEDDSEIPF